MSSSHRIMTHLKKITHGHCGSNGWMTLPALEQLDVPECLHVFHRKVTVTFIRPNSSTYTSGCHPPEPHGAVFKKSWKPSVYFWDCAWKHSGDPVELFGCCGVPTHLPINSIYPSTNSSKHLGFCHPQNSKWPIERHHVDPHGTRLRTLGTRWFASSCWTGFFGMTMSCEFHSSSGDAKRT